MSFYKLSIIISIAITTFLIYGCSDNSAGSDDSSNLSENEEQMIGTWKLIRIEDSPEAGPVEDDIEWTFHEDGSGKYYQNIEGFGERSQTIYWRLDGNDILFTDENGSGEPVYRVDEWGSTQMRWHNYTLGDTYVVEKT